MARDRPAATGLPALLNPMKCPIPACLIEKVNELVKGRSCLFTQRYFFGAAFRHCYGPVDEKRPTQDILPWNKPPVAAIHAVRAVVAHHKVIAGRDDQVEAMNLVLKCDRPFWRDAGLLSGSYEREVVNVWIVVCGCGLVASGSS